MTCPLNELTGIQVEGLSRVSKSSNTYYINLDTTSSIESEGAIFYGALKNAWGSHENAFSKYCNDDVERRRNDLFVSTLKILRVLLTELLNVERSFLIQRIINSYFKVFYYFYFETENFS